MPFDTEPPISRVRSLTLNSTAQAIKAGKGRIVGLSVINRDTVEIFFKLYNKAHGSVNPASDVPFDEVRIPVDSQFFLRGADMPWDFDTAISMRCVTGIGDTDTTNPGTSPKVIVFYK